MTCDAWRKRTPRASRAAATLTDTEKAMKSILVAFSLAALVLPNLAVGAGEPAAKPAASAKDQAHVEQATDRLIGVVWNDADAKQQTARFLNAHQAHRDAVASLQQCQNCHGGSPEGWLRHVDIAALQPTGPWIGISVGPADPVLRSQLRLPEGAGVVVTQVVPEGPAHQAGVEPDDVLLSVNGKPVASGEDLDKVLQSAAGEGDGTPLTLKLLHAGEPVEKQVTPRKENYATFVVDLLSEARPTYRIGVAVNDPDQTLRRQLKLGDGGVVVSEVYPGKPAEAAGIKAGDVLLSANGKRLAKQEELTEAVQRAAESPLELELMRGGVRLKINVTPAREAPTENVALSAFDLVELRPEMKELLLVRPGDAKVVGGADVTAADYLVSVKAQSTDERIAEMAEQIRQLRAAVESLRDHLEGGSGRETGAK